MCVGIFQHDNVDRKDVETLVDAFPGQSLDFFGALRARVYDDKVRDWITTIGVENIGKRLINSRDGKVEFDKPSVSERGREREQPMGPCPPRACLPFSPVACCCCAVCRAQDFQSPSSLSCCRC